MSPGNGRSDTKQTQGNSDASGPRPRGLPKPAKFLKNRDLHWPGTLVVIDEGHVFAPPQTDDPHALIWDKGMREFPPRLAHQPIFYPVANLEYARQIARDWNTADEKSGFSGL
jgi:hypothetical protein